MTGDGNLEETAVMLAVLYADVSGSTHIYETHGDTIARQNIEQCLNILAGVVDDYNGRVEKTIGDEVMCSFPDPIKAALAAKDMQQTLLDAADLGRFSIGRLHIKIGWHYGEVHYMGGEMVGEAPVTAQQVIKLAKADEILTSGQSVNSLPEELKYDARLIDTVEAEGYPGKLHVYTLPWEEEEELTRMGTPSPAPDENATCKTLMLEYAGRELRLDHEHTRCRIGRGPENDVCVNGRFTSRQHAEIVYRHGLFHLYDNSTNGTALMYADGRTARLHREEAILSDTGTICFGGLPETDPEAAVRFQCGH